MNNENEKEALELDQIRLKNKKLELQIKKLKRPFYLEPGYLTLFFTVISLAIAYYNGFFDLQRQKLDWEKKKLEERKQKLIDEIAVYEFNIDSLKTLVNESKIQLKDRNKAIEYVDSSFMISINTLEEVIFNNPDLDGKEAVLDNLTKMRKLKIKREKLKRED